MLRHLGQKSVDVSGISPTVSQPVFSQQLSQQGPVSVIMVIVLLVFFG
jgi:hypothetical protein